jgi:hypothetical protein
MGFNVKISVPSSVEEHDKLAGRPNATLEDAIDTNVYRGTLADFRDGICEKLESTTGIKRKASPVLDKDNKPKTDDEGNPVEKWDETEQEYVRRVCVETNRAVESFQDVADEVSAGLVYDPTVKERQPAGPKTPPKSVYAIADKLVSDGKATHVAASLAKILGRHVDHDRDSLARAIHEDNLNERRKQLAKYTS